MLIGFTGFVRPRFLLKDAACLVVSSLLVATVVSGAPPTVDVQVVEDTADRIVLTYTFAAPTLERLVIEGQDHVAVHLGGESLSQERGAPALPTVSRSLIIPDLAHMTARVLSSTYHEEKGVSVVPSKGVITRDIDPATVPFVFGPEYERDGFTPDALVTLGDPYILRDHRGMVVTVHPVLFNPRTGVLRMYTRMTVELIVAGPAAINPFMRNRAEQPLSQAFHDLYTAQFLNYRAPKRYDPLTETGDMLIIVYDPWTANVEPLAAHKNAAGINTTIATVTDAGGSAAGIAAYIQNVYDTSDLAFVLLVGDSAQLPTLSAAGGASDPSYALVAGSDSYPDLLLGRFSAETAAQVDTQVQRTIAYENLPATAQDWFRRGVGVASDEGAGIGDDGESDIQHLNNVRADLLGNGYTVVDQVYDPGASASAVSSAINAGRGIINYTGHGSTTSWGTTGFSVSHINALTNDNMLPFIIDVACVNGEFDGPTCFAEAWMRATNGSAPTGAIAIYASSINQSWAPPMCAQDEVTDLFVAEAYHSLGTLCYAGSCQMMDEYGTDGQNMYKTWHLFGDPSLRVVGTLAPPTGMGVSPSSGLTAEGPNGGPFAPDGITYTITNYDDVPLTYSVSHAASWLTLSSTGGLVPEGGTTDVIVTINSAATALGNGHYDDVITFTNLTNGDGDTTRSVSLHVGAPVAVHVFSLDQRPKWVFEGQWDHGQPTGGGGGSYGNPDPTSGATGSNVCGVNLDGDYSTAIGGPYHLTTEAIDCSDLTDVSLRFERWLNTDYTPYAHATVEASLDNVNWSTLWTNGGDTIAEGGWSHHEFDLSALADNQSSLYVRWGYEIGQSGVWPYSGWNIDDIEIWGVQPSPAACPADVTADGLVNTDDFLGVLSHWGNYDPQFDCNNDGAINTDDVLAILAGWGECP